jgi:hypothetical protein
MKSLIKKLIAESYDEIEANNYLTFKPTNDQVQQLAEAGNSVLTRFPYQAGACALMSAMWGALIRDNTDFPIHVVAGSLYIDGQHIFGSDPSANHIKDAFVGKNLDWDGHCWVAFGDLIGDVSIFRTAYSKDSPPILKNKVLSSFGEGRGLFVATMDSMIENGFKYEPKYILTDNEISGLFKGAFSLINSKNT